MTRTLREVTLFWQNNREFLFYKCKFANLLENLANFFISQAELFFKKIIY